VCPGDGTRGRGRVAEDGAREELSGGAGAFLRRAPAVGSEDVGRGVRGKDSVHDRSRVAHDDDVRTGERGRVRGAGRTHDPLSLGRLPYAGRRAEMRRIAWILAVSLPLAAADGPIELSLRRAVELAISP